LSSGLENGFEKNLGFLGLKTEKKPQQSKIYNINDNLNMSVLQVIVYLSYITNKPESNMCSVCYLLNNCELLYN